MPEFLEDWLNELDNGDKIILRDWIDSEKAATVSKVMMEVLDESIE
jgi:hypothetical protein